MRLETRENCLDYICGNFMDGEDSLLKEENCVASRKTCAVFNKKEKVEMDVLLKRFWSLEFHQLASVYK